MGIKKIENIKKHYIITMWQSIDIFMLLTGIISMDSPRVNLISNMVYY